MEFFCESFCNSKQKIAKRLPPNPKESPFFPPGFGITIASAKGKTETQQEREEITMKLKRTMSMVMAGTIAAGMLAGCGSNGSSGGGSAASDGSAQKEMTFVIANRDEFMSKVEQAMTAEGEKLGYKIVTQDAQLDTAKQMQYVETCANAGQEAVAVLLVDTEAAQSIMDSAGEMKVAFVNRQPADLHVLDAENACYVGSDEFTSGYFQGEYLAQYFKDKGKTDIKYLMLQGTLGQVATTQRSEGALQALKDNGINATEGSAPLAADFDRPTAQEMIQPLLTTTEYDCIIANNDAMALGAVEACREAGVEIDFPIVGIDCTADGAQALIDGNLAMTVFQDPVGQGRGAILACMNMINGDPINTGMEKYALDDSGESYSDSICWVPFEPVTVDNVADYM